jgi:lipopolysaccharide/colanic/teichoic acid biosynthesis glycosyltransferase
MAIIVESGLPVFFGQIRIGRGGVPFRLWKLRTMRSASGPLITASRDSRITRTGAFLRKYKLDELPQLWNTLRGQMSVVGPRPEVPEYVSLDDPLWRKILSVRPGITDVATLIYRNEEDVLANSAHPEKYYREVVLPKKLSLNNDYMRRASFWSDFRLMYLTAVYSIRPHMLDDARVRNSRN